MHTREHGTHAQRNKHATGDAQLRMRFALELDATLAGCGWVSHDGWTTNAATGGGDRGGGGAVGGGIGNECDCALSHVNKRRHAEAGPQRMRMRNSVAIAGNYESNRMAEQNDINIFNSYGLLAIPLAIFLSNRFCRTHPHSLCLISHKNGRCERFNESAHVVTVTHAHVTKAAK